LLGAKSAGSAILPGKSSEKRTRIESKANIEKYLRVVVKAKNAEDGRVEKGNVQLILPDYARIGKYQTNVPDRKSECPVFLPEY
jgi:hypothetical protein